MYTKASTEKNRKLEESQNTKEYKLKDKQSQIKQKKLVTYSYKKNVVSSSAYTPVLF